MSNRLKVFKPGFKKDLLIYLTYDLRLLKVIGELIIKLLPDISITMNNKVLTDDDVYEFIKTGHASVRQIPRNVIKYNLDPKPNRLFHKVRCYGLATHGLGSSESESEELSINEDVTDNKMINVRFKYRHDYGEIDLDHECYSRKDERKLCKHFKARFTRTARIPKKRFAREMLVGNELFDDKIKTVRTLRGTMLGVRSNGPLKIKGCNLFGDTGQLKKQNKEPYLDFLHEEIFGSKCSDEDYSPYCINADDADDEVEDYLINSDEDEIEIKN